MEINIILGALIFILSAFQSIFGIGLLALGTPLLLIGGFSFIEALFLLLPCSIAVSSLTFFLINKEYKKYLDREVVKNFILYSIPGIIMGLIIIIFYELNLNFKILIGTTIIISIFLKKFIKKKFIQTVKMRRVINLFIGFIHGISNMGGSFLSIYLLTMYNDKIKIRYHLTLAYIFFAFTQLLFLSLTYNELNNLYNVKYIFIFSILGALLGNFLENFFNNEFFLKILNISILITALILVVKSLTEIY